MNAPREQEIKKELKKRLGEGLILPAGHGLFTASCDMEEYRQSKDIGGFIHQMPIAVHVIGSNGAGQEIKSITRYLSIEEAELLRSMIDFHIRLLQEAA